MRVIETPEQMRALLHECIDVTYHWIAECNKRFDLSIPKLRVEFTLKGRTAGLACITEGFIKYNPTLLRENTDDFLQRTPPHEVCHFAAYAKHGFGIKAHGEEWKSMMWALGVENSRCHSFDCSRVPTQLGKRPNHQKVIITNEHGIVRPVGIGRITEFD